MMPGEIIFTIFINACTVYVKGSQLFVKIVCLFIDQRCQRIVWFNELMVPVVLQLV